jgi:thiamine biosynthesis protein ThiI
MMKKAVSLISGGIDSPVAAYLMLEKGLDLVFLTFDNYPFSDGKAVNKTKRLINVLSRKFDRDFKIYVINHGVNHKIISERCNERYHCVICKIIMLKTAEKIAKKENADFIVMGDNLSQVASQTLDNMKVIDSFTSLNVLRPLLCYDKDEIVKLAKEIGTYDISIEKSVDCTAVPKRPITLAKLNKVKEELEKINL